ncbi:MAG: hypothetical protein OXF76_16080 [Caldilineaceae bacterium]|nr:hypothetical protein [Caldilineaceae bacterium]
MGAWITFLKERIPAFSYLLLAIGLAASGYALNKLTAGPELASYILWTIFAIPAAGAFLFFTVLRIMDEYKDYNKDRVAHPQRPLPRGVLAPAQVARAVNGLVVFMLIYAFAVGIAYRPAGLAYLLLTGYLWLMYREFYAGAWLSDRPILYAASHQVILLPLCYFSALFFDPDAWRRAVTFSFAITVLGAFFTYEICRKLDPNAHPLIGTYLSHYGTLPTIGLAVGTVALSALGALGLGLGPPLWPFELLLLALMALLIFAPHRFRIVEYAASLSLVLHVWAIALIEWLRVTGLTA